MDIDVYLARINYEGSREPTAETLRALHRAHMLTVPFENLDIHLKHPIQLDEAALFDKIVWRRRGGFCYELNGLFAALLRSLGFDVTLLSARVMDGGEPGPEFDHLALLVKLDKRWLADVGFGESSIEPLRLDNSSEEHADGQVYAYRITHDGDDWTVWERNTLTDLDWQTAYTFTLQPRRLADFEGMCRYHQISPESSFTQKRICTRATPDGRITLSEMRLIETVCGQRRERTLMGEDEYADILHECFGVVLEV